METIPSRTHGLFGICPCDAWASARGDYPLCRRHLDEFTLEWKDRGWTVPEYSRMGFIQPVDVWEGDINTATHSEMVRLVAKILPPDKRPDMVRLTPDEAEGWQRQLLTIPRLATVSNAVATYLWWNVTPDDLREFRAMWMGRTFGIVAEPPCLAVPPASWIYLWKLYPDEFPQNLSFDQQNQIIGFARQVMRTMVLRAFKSAEIADSWLHSQVLRNIGLADAVAYHKLGAKPEMARRWELIQSHRAEGRVALLAEWITEDGSLNPVPTLQRATLLQKAGEPITPARYDELIEGIGVDGARFSLEFAEALGMHFTEDTTSSKVNLLRREMDKRGLCDYGMMVYLLDLFTAPDLGHEGIELDDHRHRHEVIVSSLCDLAVVVSRNPHLLRDLPRWLGVGAALRRADPAAATDVFAYPADLLESRVVPLIESGMTLDVAEAWAGDLRKGTS